MLRKLAQAIMGSKATISGRELLECLEAMTAKERRAMVDLLIPHMGPWPNLSGSSSMAGYQACQEFFAKMTPEQRSQLERDCLL
jgi:hypothetical protein